MHYIGLLDCNNFFVSCERLFRPDLRKKPVLVLSSNDGCVIARSQEIKDNGIPMGVPYFQIKDKLTEIGATQFSSNFTLYRDISRRVFEVVRRHAAVVEEYSIDECFFMIDAEQAEENCWAIKAAVEREVGIPVSIGIAKSKTLAKYANGHAKKTNGLCLLTDEEWERVVPTLPLSALWGVGLARTRAFAHKQIVTVADLLATPSRNVGTWFGIEGVRLVSELSGVAALFVSTEIATPKSITSSRSFAESTTKKTVVEDALSFHLHQVVADLVQQDLCTESLRVFFYPSRHSDYVLHGYSAEVTFTEPTYDLVVLRRALHDLVEAGYRTDVPYKKAGVVCMALKPRAERSLSLFTDLTKTTDLTVLLQSLNQRLGKECLQLGRTLDMKAAWSARQDSLSPAYTTAWQSLKTVYAT